MKNKSKILYVGIALILGIISIGFGIFVIFSSQNKDNTPVSTTTPGNGFGGLSSGTTGTLGGKPETATTSENSNTTNGAIVPSEPKKLPKLRELTDVPVAGSAFIETSTTSIIRYMQRSDGHVWDTYKDQELWIRQSQMTIPKVYEAWWFGTKANTVVLRLLDQNTGESQNYLANLTLKPTSTSKALDRPSTSGEAPYILVGKFIDAGTRSLTTLPTNQKELSFLSTKDATSILYTVATSGKISQRAAITGSEFQIQWPNQNNFYLTTNASALFDGSLFVLSDKETIPHKILTGKKGLTTLVSPGGKYILYSESTDNDFSLNMYTVASSTSIKLPVKTFPEKCVWISEKPASIYCGVPNTVYKGAYPDLWYKGQVYFYDTIFKIDIDSYYKTELANYTGIMKKAVDMTDLKLSADASYLIFTNKLDGHLWGFSLKDL